MTFVSSLEKSLNHISEDSWIFQLAFAVPFIGEALITMKARQIYKQCVSDAQSFNNSGVDEKAQKLALLNEDRKRFSAFFGGSIQQLIVRVVSLVARVFLWFLFPTILPVVDGTLLAAGMLYSAYLADEANLLYQDVAKVQT
jgi:hypothetical protein